MRHSTMRAIAIAALIPVLGLPSAPAWAHAHLDYATPRVGSTVATSPAQVTLHFTQKLEAKFTKAEVRNAAGARVDTGSSVGGNIVTVSVGSLPAGTYRVTWRVLSVDTHSTQGSFSFRVGK